jgi:Ca-activated chloride channel family protein
MKRVLTLLSILVIALACAKNKQEEQVVGSGGIATTEGWSAPASLPPPGRTGGMTYSAGDSMAPKPQYAKVEENAFKTAKDEPVTTFAIDVDRASYANVRRFLHDGMAPPPDAVRIEEMINYFTYHYPQPSSDVPFSITTEVAGCPWNANNRLLRIGIQGRNLDAWKMAPNNLVFLIDVSGSMEPPQRLPLLKSAFRLLAEQLRPEDSVAIVVYAGAAGLVLPPTSGDDKGAILDAIDNLEAGGSTAGGAGIELAYETATGNFMKDGNNRVILATDGDFNVGVSSVEELEKLIEQKRKSGIHLSVLGVGDDNYHDANLETLADKGNGNYAYLDSLKEAEKVFKHELTGTLVTIAKDVKVQLEFDPSLVESYRQIGYENRALKNEDFDNDEKDAGELGAGHSVTALYEITPAPSLTTSARGTIATVKLRYKEPKEEVSKLIVASAKDEGTSAYAASADMQFASAVAELGMLLRDSPHKGTSSYADVMQLARVAHGEDLDGLREEFTRLADSARVMTATSGQRAAGGGQD